MLADGCSLAVMSTQMPGVTNEHCVAAHLILSHQGFEVKINLTTRRVRFPVVLKHGHLQRSMHSLLMKQRCWLHVVNDMQRYVLQIPY